MTSEKPLTRPRPAEAFRPPALPRISVRQIVGALRRNLWILLVAILAGAAVSALVMFRPVGVYEASAVVRFPGVADLAPELESVRSREFAASVVASGGLRVFDPGSQLPATGVTVVRMTAPPDSMVFVRMTFGPSDLRAKMGDAEAVAGYGDTLWFPDLEFAVTAKPAVAETSLVIIPQSEAIDWVLSVLSARIVTAPNALAIRAVSLSPAVATRLLGAVLTAYQAPGADGRAAKSIQILERPVEASPLRENSRRHVAIVLSLALVLGLGAVIARERLDTTIRRRVEMEYRLHVPGLAMIPKLPTGFVTKEESADAGSTAFRVLRSRLLERANGTGGEAARSVVVTSAEVRDGSTTTAANLAASFADKGRRVLLMDCNMRRPRLHDVFHTKAKPGLAEVLVDRVELQDAFRKTAIRNLYLLPAGEPPAQASVLLTSKRFGAMLASLAMLFDIVIIDAPPMLAATDASIVAGMVDGVLVVVRAGSTTGDMAQEVLRQLDVGKAHVLGAVLNDPDGIAAMYESPALEGARD